MAVLEAKQCSFFKFPQHLNAARGNLQRVKVTLHFAGNGFVGIAISHNLAHHVFFKLAYQFASLTGDGKDAPTLISENRDVINR
ncbi:hypothetical protein M5J15_12315 [Serratia symbiotica]|uniref:hypothetical protein n=1 Tax=Serratia symbiotica TaxID=138074 RepID=UPI0020913EC5|nr:hypothetical protein [Serratia symbiotica]USS95289.1 hypothetical protein M5J15_12315 [Serratia symbiotica]